MKITIVCDVLGSPNNGTTLAAYNLINFLKSRGHEVTVVCADKDKEGVAGYSVVPIKNFGPLNALLRANNVYLAKADKNVLSRAIEGADVVHILIPLHLGSAASKIAQKAGIPIPASFHAQAENVTAHIACMNSRFVNHLVYLYFYRSLYKRVDIIHYPTRFIKEVFEKHVKRTMPCRVISNGVNDIYFTKRENIRLCDKFTIFCTGRFSKEKSQQTLIKAVANCNFKDNVKIYFAGCGPREKRLRRLAKRKGVDADFKFYTRDELPIALSGADLYVHTAEVEIEAISCLEAIASGLVPVISNSKRSATKNFAIDERCLFEAGNWRDLSQKISYFYNDPKQIQAYKQKYGEFKEQFRQEDCMRKMEQMLEEAASAKKQNER